MSTTAERAFESPTRDWTSVVELGVLGAIWGASFMFQRVAAPEFGALALAELRLALGALVLLPFLWRARQLFPLRVWPMLALLGAINSAVPFALFAYAAQRAPAGIGAICNSMAVLFTALIAFLFYGEKIGLRRAAALFAGFAGVVVLASAKTAGASIGLAVAAGTGAGSREGTRRSWAVPGGASAVPASGASSSGATSRLGSGARSTGMRSGKRRTSSSSRRWWPRRKRRR